MKKTIIPTLILLFSAAIARADVLSLPLDKLTPVSSAELRCVQGEYTIVIPVPERWSVSSAKLSLKYTNSATLIAARSGLSVRMNGISIGQARLDPLKPEGLISLVVPTALLHSGYNDLHVTAAQHYAPECEQFCAPNLWTTLDFAGSTIELAFDRKAVPLKLSDVAEFLFDPKIFPSAAVHIVLENLTSEAVTQAGTVASGIARKFDYRQAQFDVSNDIRPDRDNVLIGNKKFVEAFLKQRGVNVSVPGPYLKLVQVPLGSGKTDPRYALLIVAGTNAEEIKIASETLAHLSLPFPGTDELMVKDFKLPDITLYSGRQVLTTDKIFTFKTLEFDTTTFVGFNPNSKHISFRLPADFLIRPNQYAKVLINFSYGAGMRNDSVLNIVVNDRTVRVIHLSNPNGENIEGYRIDLPTYLFKPGYNTIRFTPVLNPVARECDVLRPEGFYLTIFENSTLFFPSMPHFVEMPKLELFLVDGFPVTRWPDGYEALFYLTNRDYDTASAALNMIGQISQKNGYPLFGVKIAFEKPAGWTGEMIVLGDVASIPEDFAAKAPLKFGRKSTVPYPVIRDWDSEKSFALSGQYSSIGPDLGVIMEYESPYKTGRSVLQITGNSPREVLNTSKALLEPGVQTNVKGDLVLVDLERPLERVRAVSAGKSYYTGKQGTWFMIEYYFYKYTYLNFILLTIVIIALGIALFMLLRALRQKRTRRGDGPKTA